MIQVTKQSFGQIAGQKEAHLYLIENEKNGKIAVSDFGATLVSVLVPDRNGNGKDVVLGYERALDYQEGPYYFGATVGRCANRIANAQMTLSGKTYFLAKNWGTHHLHGGKIGFSHRLWEAQILSDGVVFYLHSPDGEEQYPGNLNVKVAYHWDEENRLRISYEAQTDRETLCNLTNHAYFNLSGHTGGVVTGQHLQILASFITETDSDLIPTGKLIPVEGTPFDFRKGKRIGEGIDDMDSRIQWAGGWDHNWVLDKEEGKRMSVAARAYSDESGISLTCETTLPGLQVYTPNFQSQNDPLGKGGALYRGRQAFCLETQHFPDAVHHSHFPSPILRPGQRYREETVFTFSIK